MATAAEQAQRDEEIRAAHTAGASTEALMSKFGLKKSRINQILAASAPLVKRSSSWVKRAEARHEAYLDLYLEVRAHAAAIPETQPAAKVGAYRLVFEALGHLTSLEQQFGYLPRDLGEVGYMRQLTEAVLRLFEKYGLPPEAADELLAGFEGEGRQA